MEESIIRHIEHKDIRELILISKEMHKEGGYSWLPYSSEKMNQLFRKCLKFDMVTCIVAEKDNKVIGYMIVVIQDYFFNYKKMCSDLGLYILKEYRKNIRTPIKMVKLAEEWATERDVQELFFGNTMNVKNDKIKKCFEFPGLTTIGHVFKKKVN
jgi:hypothetical protein